MKIDKFEGDYDFLSNFYKTKIIYIGAEFATSEHLYQTMKATTREECEKIRNAPSPGSAKRYGQEIKLRANWEEIKDKVMFHACLCKFLQNGYLTMKLLETGDAYLEEGNNWGDRYWGVVDGEGKNMLGIILMKVRDILKLELNNINNK